MEKPKASSSWSLKTRISNLLQKESSSDIEFLVDVPPERYFCHKVILSAGSPVFETMFFGAIGQKSPVRVPDLTAKGFSLMLQYLYSDSVTIQDESEAFETAYVSKKYMIKSLFILCEDFVVSKLTLNPENVFSTYEEASLLEMKNLQASCLRYVSRNAQSIFQGKSFTKASKNTFQDILRLDVMNIESEMEVIEALWLWGKEQCKESGIKCSEENVRSCTKEFVKHIRFFALSMDELVNVLEKCHILDTSDEIMLLWNIAMPKTEKKVSDDICTESRNRSITNSSKVQLPANYRYDGNMTAFLIENHKEEVEVTVIGPPVTIIGFVIAFKPISCYSPQHRSLQIEISVTNNSSDTRSCTKSQFKAEKITKKEEEQFLLLDDYVVVKEKEVVNITVNVTGEGVNVMQCMEEKFCFDLGKSEISLKFAKSTGQNKIVLPIKELMVV